MNPKLRVEQDGNVLVVKPYREDAKPTVGRLSKKGAKNLIRTIKNTEDYLVEIPENLDDMLSMIGYKEEVNGFYVRRDAVLPKSTGYVEVEDRFVSISEEKANGKRILVSGNYIGNLETLVKDTDTIESMFEEKVNQFVYLNLHMVGGWLSFLCALGSAVVGTKLGLPLYTWAIPPITLYGIIMAPSLIKHSKFNKNLKNLVADLSQNVKGYRFRFAENVLRGIQLEFNDVMISKGKLNEGNVRVEEVEGEQVVVENDSVETEVQVR